MNSWICICYYSGCRRCFFARLPWKPNKRQHYDFWSLLTTFTQTKAPAAVIKQTKRDKHELSLLLMIFTRQKAPAVVTKKSKIWKLILDCFSTAFHLACEPKSGHALSTSILCSGMWLYIYEGILFAVEGGASAAAGDMSILSKINNMHRF